MTSFKEKKILITGSAQGLGRLLAEEAAKKGAKELILLDLNTKCLEETKESLKGFSCLVKTYPCDLSKREQTYEIANEILNESGGVDILILNAGMVQGKKILDTNDDLIEKTFLVNAISNFWLTKVFLPKMMEKNEGHIVSISSISAFATTTKLCDYAASKSASFSFNETLRLELADQKSNIKTSVICPYYMNTGMFKGVKPKFSFILDFLKPEEVCKKIIHTIEKNKEILITPKFCLTIFISRLFPPFVGDWLHRFMGINKGMDDFVGRKKIE
ncbi:MAG: short-chain dehydrogenase [Halobacteriovoraceae bacterium]|nr:short-chain dehydrogenase [Halobacteriovoraceae bacterium]